MKSKYDLKSWLRSIALTAVLASAPVFSLFNYAVTQSQLKTICSEVSVCKKDTAAVKETYEKKEKLLDDKIKKLEDAVKGAQAKLGNDFEMISDGKCCRIIANGKFFHSSYDAGTTVLDVLKKHFLSYKQNPDEIASIICRIDSDCDNFISDYEAGIAREKTEVHYRNLEEKTCQILSELDKY